MTTSGRAETNRRTRDGYLPIEHYGIIGNMRTCALVGIDGSLDFMCWPEFDSPSIFCRLLDKNKGGYFGISPPREGQSYTTKQSYMPSTNILRTRYIHEEGVVDLVDFFPRPTTAHVLTKETRHMGFRQAVEVQDELKKWLVRRVECIRGTMDIDIECFPAFDYAREVHETEILIPKHTPGGDMSKAVVFRTDKLKLQIDITIDCDDENSCPDIFFEKSKSPGMLGEGVMMRCHLQEGQAISFVLRDEIPDDDAPLTTALIDKVQHDTQSFWFNWISKSKYKGRWREVVSRSLMILKLLTYEPTGAIVAAPTFSIPEQIGGVRNWDYRYCWVRDSSFTIYIFLKLGFHEEADAFMNFMSNRHRYNRSPEGALPIMFTIHGGVDIPELTLDHLEGYRASSPVRIGNEAAFHQQWDIYGELLDTIYLYNKYGKPITWDQWISIREIIDYIMTIYKEPDMSIWEVRNQKQNFTYSKIMLWVAFDRALRLAEKRCLPCPNRAAWLATRDELCEEIHSKGYSSTLQTFIQSYESPVLDSSILIAPLVFFISPNDPRLLRTIDKILLPPEKGGLTSTGLVYRYDTSRTEDGVGGREGAFSMCTFWLVEALTRAGRYDHKYLVKAITTFENMLGFSNHLGMFSEEIARSGEQLGNTPQAFSHLALVSAAINLDKLTGGEGGI